MTRSVMLAATLALTATAAAAAAEDAEPSVARPARITDLIAVAREEAPRWLQAKAVKPPTPAPLARRILPGRAVIRDLTTALQREHSVKGDENLYILYQLLQPARNFAAADLRAFLAQLTAIEAKAAYRPMFHLSRGQLLTLRQAANRPNTEIDRKAGKIRDAKREAERQIIKHNLLVRAIRATIARLRIPAADRDADNRVLASVEADLRGRRMTYIDGLAAIWLEVTQIDRERAEILYERLKPLVKQTGRAEVPLADPTRLDSRPEGNSRFEQTRRIVGADVAKVVNVLATAARKPAVAVPAARQARRGRRGRGNRRNRR